MIKFIPENLKKLSAACAFPLYVVGGSVRDFLSGVAFQAEHFSDWDVCAPVPFEVFSQTAKKAGFTVHSEYKNTGTVKLTDSKGVGYEFSSFRSDQYVRGEHTPRAVYFTKDITLDARRRDFTCNAVYFDIQNNAFCDPLGGIEDIKNKRIRTVRESSKVFSEDGLRLMRLARQCGQLGFSVEKDTLQGARRHAGLILDIAPERIFTELNLILHADQKYGVQNGHYLALKTLERIGVLEQILPELYEGKGMAQPAAFHRYDVLEHSLRCVLYSPPAVRWAALLHDVGKPLCMRRDGNYHRHAEEGAALSDRILERFKAPNKLKTRTHTLILQHMYDLQNTTREGKLRRYLVKNQEILPELLSLKQADFSACKDNPLPAPTVERWQALFTRMQEEGVPFTQKSLSVTGKELLAAGISAPFIGKVLHGLLLHCATQPKDNEKLKLLKLAQGLYKCFLKEQPKDI